jgi:hypothetical protein
VAIAGLAMIAWGGQALAALTITEASWERNTLEVEGTDGRGGTVEVYYGYDTPPNSTLLGTASVKGNGKWKLKIRSKRNNPLDPVPCAVSALLADESVMDFPVQGAPDDCAPQPPVGNTPPVAVDDAYSTDQDTTLTVAAPGVLGNDSDVDGDTLTAVLDTDATNGSLSLNADGSLTYVPTSPP